VKKSIISAFIASAAFAASMAQADTVTVNQVFDLHASDVATPNMYFSSSNEFAPVTIKAGDDVQLNFRFNTDQYLQINSQGGSQTFNFGLWGAAGTPANNFSISNLTFSLLWAANSGPYTGADQSSGDSFIGASITNSFIANGSSLNFTGFQANFHVDSMDQNSGSYNAGFFGVSGDALSEVPEPASFALFAAGLGLIGFARRRNAAK